MESPCQIVFAAWLTPADQSAAGDLRHFLCPKKCIAEILGPAKTYPKTLHNFNEAKDQDGKLFTWPFRNVGVVRNCIHKGTKIVFCWY